MKKNKKGFTLVELLAVIVVLAIIMIIAVPNVLDAMENARKSAFVTYGQRIIETAQTKYSTKLLFNGATSSLDGCYSIGNIMGSSTGNYSGYIEISTSESTKTTFTLYLSDSNYSFNGEELSGISDGSVKTGANRVGFDSTKPKHKSASGLVDWKANNNFVSCDNKL